MSEVKTPERQYPATQKEAQALETAARSYAEQAFPEANDRDAPFCTTGDRFDESYLAYKAGARFAASQLSPDQIVRERLEGMREQAAQRMRVAANPIDALIDDMNVTMFDRVLSLLSESEPVSLWVKTEDGLPTIGEYVMVYSPDHTFSPTPQMISRFTKHGFESAANVIAWQPLPTPPKH